MSHLWLLRFSWTVRIATRYAGLLIINVITEYLEPAEGHLLLKCYFAGYYTLSKITFRVSADVLIRTMDLCVNVFYLTIWVMWIILWNTAVHYLTEIWPILPPSCLLFLLNYTCVASCRFPPLTFVVFPPIFVGNAFSGGNGICPLLSTHRVHIDVFHRE